MNTKISHKFMHYVGALLVSSFLLICAVGCQADDVTETVPSLDITETTVAETTVPTETIPVYTHAINPLTGRRDMDFDNVGLRAVSIAINNIIYALPQRGITKADVFYEFEAEYGQTRILTVFADVNKIPEIGPVRSARIVMCDLSGTSNSIFVHYGQNKRVPNYMRTHGIDYIDGNVLSKGIDASVNGEIELSKGIYFWRDRAWREVRAIEHTAVTNGTHLLRAFEERDIPHEGETPTLFDFSERSNAIDAGANCEVLIVYFSSVNCDSTFSYNAITKSYDKSQYGGRAQIDETTGDVVSVTNVFVLFVPIEKHTDTTINIDMMHGGDGYYASEGKIIEITWTKDGVNDPIMIFDTNGDPITVTAGTNYINIVRNTRADRTTWH